MLRKMQWLTKRMRPPTLDKGEKPREEQERESLPPTLLPQPALLELSE